MQSLCRPCSWLVHTCTMPYRSPAKLLQVARPLPWWCIRQPSGTLGRPSGPCFWVSPPAPLFGGHLISTDIVDVLREDQFGEWLRHWTGKHEFVGSSQAIRFIFGIYLESLSKIVPKMCWFNHSAVNEDLAIHRKLLYIYHSRCFNVASIPVVKQFT